MENQGPDGANSNRLRFKSRSHHLPQTFSEGQRVLNWKRVKSELARRPLGELRSKSDKHMLPVVGVQHAGGACRPWKMKAAEAVGFWSWRECGCLLMKNPVAVWGIEGTWKLGGCLSCRQQLSVCTLCCCSSKTRTWDPTSPDGQFQKSIVPCIQ